MKLKIILTQFFCLFLCNVAESQQQVFVSEPTGVSNNWSTFALLTRGETVPLLGGTTGQNFSWNANHAKWDGLGACNFDSDTVRVYVNHEVSSGSVSRVDLNIPALQNWIANRVVGNDNSNQNARPAGLIEGVGAGWTNTNVTTLNRPCSGNIWEANTFGTGRGFSDRLYLTGEETFSNSGHFWAIDTATNTIHQAPSVGGAGSWENATLIDTGRTDTVALLLGEDQGASATGTARLSMYVGLKNPNGNFLERNGLVGGKTYYWDAEGTTNTNGTLQAGGLFANNNDTVAGTWKTDASNAVLFSKAEDVHTNMQTTAANFGKEAVVSSQDQAIFLADFSNLSFIAGDLGGGSLISNVKVLFKQSTNVNQNGSVGLFGGMDNLVWSADGSIYVNEDDGEGDIWQIKVSDLLSQYQLGNLNPTLSNVFQILDSDAVGAHAGGLALGISESSGIIDISSLLGYQSGSIFLTNGMGSTGDQMALLVSPTATAVPEPTAAIVAIALFLTVGYCRRRVSN